MSKVTNKQPDDYFCEETDRSGRRFLRGTLLGALGMADIAAAFSSWVLPHTAASEKKAPASHSQGSPHSMSHDDYMRQAIAMAQRVPKFPFGAVIVRRTTGEIIAKGFNRSSENPIFHGEIDAINRCAAAHSQLDWTELDLYTTAEPCPMCQSAIEWVGISTVYYGTSIPICKATVGGKSISGPKRWLAAPHFGKPE